MKYDLVIIGAGPCGLACAIEAQKANLHYIILDKGNVVESIRRYPYSMKFFSTSEMLEIGDIPFPTVEPRPTRSEAIRYYQRVVSAFNLNIKPFFEVSNVTGKDEDFTVTDGIEEINSRKVIIATGYYDLPRKLHIPGEDLPHVSHYYTEPYQYFNQNVVVVGGANSAVETALDLYRNGAQVTLVHQFEDLDKTAKYWILPDLKNRIKKGEIQAFFNAVIERIEEKRLHISQNDQHLAIEADFVFLMTGYHPDADFLSKTGIRLKGKAMIPEFNVNTYESNVPGVFLVGSIIGGEETAKVFIENGRFHGKSVINTIRS